MNRSEEYVDVYGGKVSIPPLSTLLDMRLPVVELEESRLHSAVSWLYRAVETLQQQSAKVNSELKQLQERASVKESQAVPTADTEDVRVLLWQQEQRRLGEQAQFELRLEALGAAVEGRLQRADLEALDEKVMQKLGQIAEDSKQDVSALTKLLEGHIAADRRKLQESFESLRCKVQAQLDVVLADAGVKDDAVKAAVAAAEAAAKQASHKAPRSLEVEPVFQEPGASPERRPSGLVDMHKDLQSRVEKLERSVHLLSDREYVGPPVPAAAAPGPVVNEAAIWQRFTDMDQAHMMNVQRMSELETRLARAEGRRGPRDVGKPGQPAGDWEAPMTALQTSHDSLAEEVSGNLSPQVLSLRSTLTQITKYISGETPDEETLAQSASALGWLQQRVHSIVCKHNGLTLEARLQLLEEATGSTEIFQKVRSLEQILGKLDVDAVKEVPPQLIIVKEDQETFKQDLRREVQELKVLVGCMEACVPKETRKAIQLFKRGAGVSDEEFITAGGLKLQADVEILREELQTRLADVESNAAQQCDNLSSMVQDLEAKQEKLLSLIKKSRPPSEEGPFGGGVDSSFTARPRGWSQVSQGA
mmetsp:Transcript_16336/g.38667  ORF Transcript_16336/g.38667 Transcript_16336/m.38667 type:complete len:590 (+) Transcript_16336:64-1833(+)